jgi:hypothetical protein
MNCFNNKAKSIPKLIVTPKKPRKALAHWLI